VHWLAYGCWPCALWHGLGTGSDSKSAWLLALDTACLALVAAAAGWRLWLARPKTAERPAWFRVAVGALAVLPLATVVFTATGPLQPGWARRAGTPPAVLGGHATGGRP
jgi:sulfoxide reductase heme-binding subunit YedZ